MKLTLQLVVVDLNAPTNFRDNLFKFTLYTIIIYKVGDTRCHFRRHAPFQHNFFHKITLSSNFPPREGGFGQMMYRSPERSPQDSRDRCFLYSAQASFSWPWVDLARLLRRACSQSFWIISFEFFSLWDSFFYLGKLYWFLYLLLSYFYDPGMFIFHRSSNFVEKVVLKGSMAAKMASRVSYLVYYYCI